MLEIDFDEEKAEITIHVEPVKIPD